LIFKCAVDELSASEGWDYAIGREMGYQNGGLKIFQEEYVHVSPISKTESMIKIYRETSQLWMRQNENTTNSEDSIETDCVYEAHQI
jgi:hypothetical protein